MSTEEHKALVRRAAAAQDQGDEQGFVALLSSDYRAHFPGAPLPLDREGHRQMVRVFREGFPDGEHQILDQLADGDMVATRGVWRGTHRGEFQGLPPTGRRVAITWILLARIAGDTIAAVWMEADFLGLMQQLGAVPAPAQATT